MCAVIQRGILGGFKNKIGNVVGSSWKGIATMRALPLSVANPKTSGQVNQRNKFSIATKIGSLLLATIVKPLWDRFAQQESGFNAFVSQNVAIFGGDLTTWVAALVTSKGTLASSIVQSAILNAVSNTLSVYYDTDSQGDALASDNVYITVLAGSSTALEPIFLQGFATNATRANGVVSVLLSNLVESQQIRVVYLSFRRNDGSKVSDSVFANIV